jgi:hypothetical protein
MKTKPQTIDLPEVKLERIGDGLLVTHKKSGATTTIAPAALERWLVRQLRSIFA